jgi:Mg-chelatase subunit ChlD
MRNHSNGDQSSLSSWTVPTTVETESYVHLEEGKVLSLLVTPRNESIGFFSDQRTTKVCVTIKACELPDEDDDKRSPVDIIVSLDVSRSMQGNKLTDCKRTLELMLRHLSSKDRLGLVTYGSYAKIEIPACFMTRENKETALRKIQAMLASGNTNLSGGLSLAAQEMQLIQQPNPVRSIFLLTDGMANMGIINTEGLVAMVQSLNSAAIPPAEEMDNLLLDEASCDAASVDTKPKAISIRKTAPISLFCFGYGSDHNSNMLESIANASPGGAYYFVEKDSDISTAFGDAMGGLLSVVAQSSVVSISVPPASAAKGVKIVNVHHDEKIPRDDGSYTITVGDFYAEESRDVLFDLELSHAPSDTASVPHVMVTLSYMDTIHNKTAKEGPMECSIGRPSNLEVSPTNLHVEEQWLRIRTVQEMAAADEEAQNNNLEAARARMQANHSFLLQSPAYLDFSAVTMTLAADVQTTMNGFASPQQYRTTGTHANKCRRMKHSKQRCMESAPDGDAFYTNQKKSKLAKAFQSGSQVD